MKPFFKLFTNKAAMLGFYAFNTTPSYSLRPILANSKILVFQPLFAKLTPHSQGGEGVKNGQNIVHVIFDATPFLHCTYIGVKIRIKIDGPFPVPIFSVKILNSSMMLQNA